MAYTNVPANLYDYMSTIQQRLRKLESAPDGSGIEAVTFAPAGFAPNPLTGAPVEFDILTSPIYWFSQEATANSTVNFTGQSNVSLNDAMYVNQSITCALIIKNGITPYYPINFLIDGVAPTTVVWAYGQVPISGTASAEDVYSFSITKLSNTPTWHLRAQVVPYV